MWLTQQKQIKWKEKKKIEGSFQTFTKSPVTSLLLLKTFILFTTNIRPIIIYHRTTVTKISS